MKEKIFEFIKKRPHASFVELSNSIPNFKGDGAMIIRENLVLWNRVSEEAIEAINSLQIEKRIKMVPTLFLTYLVDGCILRLPVAKRIRDYKYPHWLPVTFRVCK